MATDATGTPTSLGIPTYNINVDAPSGNGNTAQMEAIDALLAERALIASPTFTGTPAAPTPTGTDNSTKLATTAFVQSLIAGLVSAGSLVPSGTIVQTAATAAPSGWLMADGSAVNRTTYANLFAAIGTTYGAGDGSTTFNVPDLRGRVPVGKNSATFATLGASGGEETHILLAAEMPSHTHSISSVSAGTPSGSINSVSAGTPAGSINSVSAGTPSGTVSVSTDDGTATPSDIALHYINLASHVNTHTDVAGFSGNALAGHAHTFTGSAMAGHAHTFTGSALAAHTHTIGSAGSGGAHNNLQPYLVVNHIIKT